MKGTVDVPIDDAGLPGLAEELLTMAEEDEQAVHQFFAAAVADPVLAAALHDHVGWHPGQDPVEMWESTERAPTPIWMVRWPDPPVEVRSLVDTISSHTAQFRGVIDRYGWPRRFVVGEDGADAAWFLAMHADQDPDLQHRCLEGITKALPSVDADPRHYAGLYDRIQSAANGTQLYGTLAVPANGGVRYLVPVNDLHQLDERRWRLGLPTVESDLHTGAGQLPYRHLRRTPSFQWPRRRVLSDVYDVHRAGRARG